MPFEQDDATEILRMLCDLDQYSALIVDYVQGTDLVGGDDDEFKLTESNVKAALAHLEIASIHISRCQAAKETAQ